MRNRGTGASQTNNRVEDPERFMLELVAIDSTDWNTPPAVRIRAALKGLRRGYGLRCLSVRSASPEGAAPDG